MCTIWVKEAGTPMPDDWEALVRRLVLKNKDGNGLMWSGTRLNSAVNCVKGLMKVKELLEEIEKIEDPESKHIIIHARISTHGTTDEAMTHPFPIVRDLESMSALRWKAKAALAHNGILSDFGDVVDKNVSDSAHFAQFMSFLNLDELLAEDSVLFDYVNEIIGHNRVVIVYKGRLIYFGTWREPKKYEGSCFSNGDYEVYKPPVYSTGKGRAGNSGLGYSNGYNAGYSCGGYLYDDDWNQVPLDADGNLIAQDSVEADADDEVGTATLDRLNSVKYEVVCDSSGMCNNWSCPHKIPHEPKATGGCFAGKECQVDGFNFDDARCHSIERHMGNYRLEISDLNEPCIACGEYCEDDDFWEFEITWMEEKPVHSGSLKGATYNVVKSKTLYLCSYCQNSHPIVDQKGWFEIFEKHFKEKEDAKGNIHSGS